MYKETISLFIEHIQEQFKEILRAEEHKERLLDGQKYFGGAEWMECAQASWIEVLYYSEKIRKYYRLLRINE